MKSYIEFINEVKLVDGHAGRWNYEPSETDQLKHPSYKIISKMFKQDFGKDLHDLEDRDGELDFSSIVDDIVNKWKKVGMDKDKPIYSKKGQFIKVSKSGMGYIWLVK